MNTFELYKNGVMADILVEEDAYGGVKKISNTIADDIELVTGMRPRIISELSGCTGKYMILMATVNKSPLIRRLVKNGKIDLKCLEGRNEVFLIQNIEAPFPDNPEVKKLLLIAGSDKRGTIYGMFHLSELCGVSPLVFWGDVMPQVRQELILSFESRILSKEPSVKYRGFFINDEWPAFGKWCFEKFGGVNAKAYEKVFELLLRLKGNYLWPAMWRSSFWEDGPGLDNAKLADEYGVIIGTSHHEPCCRAGVEWQNQYKMYADDSTWSFITNSDAITRFWEDGLRRSKDFENIITIGMRGENDSKLLGENATIKDNVEVLKKAILTQNRLIKSVLGRNLKDVPRMFAVYKEVEDFFFGDQSSEGLKGWPELDDVILLLSDDNYGNLRSIPLLTEKAHPGGYGIYYHFDYHGAPVSYEWQNCTNLVKVWEQLTFAYEYGIRTMWIVNAGDIKGNEYPLSYFMELAYDYDTWGSSCIDSPIRFTKAWVEKCFGCMLSDSQKKAIADILFDYSRWNAARRPESLNENVYRNNYHECERVWQKAREIIDRAEGLRQKMPARLIPAYDSMIYYPAVASANLLLLNIEAGMNHTLADRGSVFANHYIESIKKRIEDDQKYIKEFHSMLGGKWNHMMESAHTGFRTWDDNNWTYPAIREVIPIPTPKIIVSFRGDNTYNLGEHWQDKEPICNSEFTRPDINEIILDIESRGKVDFKYEIIPDKPWLKFSRLQGEVKVKKSARASIVISCDRSKLSGEDYAVIIILFEFADGERKRARVAVRAGNPETEEYHGAFLEAQDYICIEAEHYDGRTDVDGMGFRAIFGLGRTGSAIKAFPVTENWLDKKNKPFVEYSFITRKEGEYNLSFFFSPRNPMKKGEKVRACFSINEGTEQYLDVVSENYYAEWFNKDWSFGVVNNVRIISTKVNVKKGKNIIRFYATEPNVILEQILLYPAGNRPGKTQLAPAESYKIP